MKRGLGFVSPAGIVIALVLVAAVVAVTLAVSPMLFSPGPLNAQARTALGGVTSHAQLGRDCAACHPPPWSSRTMADACLACHTDVAGEIRAKSGVHGKLVGGAASPTCRGCHPEHNGPNGVLTSFDEKTFPHDLTGYSLATHRHKSSGAAFTCRDCHPNGYSAFDVAVCADCHARMDAAFMSRHEAIFGKDCLPCHNGNGKFTVDHSKFPFKLTGKHAGLPCDDCHAGAQTLADFQKAPQDCYSCHAKNDAHSGSFGRDCGACHSTSGWAGATFSHDIFPVDHGTDQQQSTCKTCHPVNTAHYTCFGCHRHTTANVVGEHEGRSLAQLQDCIKCHAGGKGGGD